MTTRRALLVSLGGIALAAVAWGLGAFRATMSAAEARVARRSSVIETTAGPLEYAIAGRGPPLMMIHGTGGGFDQGLLFANCLREAGLQIVAPSRFGYLRSALPDDASPAHQADVLVELLDHLGLDRIAVAGGSAGALTAAEFALRHPDRCAQLILIVPAANLTGRDPVEFSAVQRMAVERVLNSDAWFWAFVTLAPDKLQRTLLATDPALLDRVSPDERSRADLIREGLMPISRKTDGLRNDGYWAGTPTQTAFDQALCDQVLAQIAEAGMHVSPTLVVANFYTGNWPAPDTPRMRMLPPGVRVAWAGFPAGSDDRRRARSG